jgi:ABC-type sugar transport system substrate-binding protein
MPSSDVATRLRERLWTQRNLTVSTAIVAGLLVTYGFGVAFSPDGSFLLLLTVGVVVPTLYDEYWPPYDQAWKAVGWVVGASAVASGVFVSLYWVGSEVVGLSSLAASVGPFLLTTIGGIAVLRR